MALPTLDLWTLVQERPKIDPNDLADAVVSQISDEPLDYRTRMLIHDSVDALNQYWGLSRTEKWLAHCPFQHEIGVIRQEAFDKVGFPSLRRRLMEKTKPERVRQFLEAIGQQLKHRVRVYVGGSIALILPGYISRRTEDIYVVGEVPEEIRQNHPLADRLEKIFGLRFGHVQSHYFPMNWQNRAHYLDTFEELQVYLLDVYDVFLSKLFSSREKDQEDLLVLAPQLDKSVLAEKLKADTRSFLAAPRLLEIATDNWKILYGELLPQ
jgi:Nucleotidyltransferase of unknown function (DUF6036)